MILEYIDKGVNHLWLDATMNDLWTLIAKGIKITAVRDYREDMV